MDHYCDCHKKHTASIAAQQKIADQYHETHSQLWDSIKQKADTKWFIILVSTLITLGVINLKLQATVYDSIKNIETEIAVVKQDIKHMKGWDITPGH